MNLDAAAKRCCGLPMEVQITGRWIGPALPDTASRVASRLLFFGGVLRAPRNIARSGGSESHPAPPAPPLISSSLSSDAALRLRRGLTSVVVSLGVPGVP